MERLYEVLVVFYCQLSRKELALLAGNDTDSFNRWEAMQLLGTKAQRSQCD